MQILAHRGLWHSVNEKNSPQALYKALETGFGFESDIRDYMGDLVISHNVANADCQKAEEVFKWLRDYEDKYCFAMNIKADGLKDCLKHYLTKYQIKNYFLFDMSIPQMIEFSEMGLQFYTRQSEVEPMLSMYKEAAGIWVDGFWGTEWITEELLLEHINNGKVVCLVSPDLHGDKNYQKFWKKLKSYSLNFKNIMLCTDYPIEANKFFGEQL